MSLIQGQMLTYGPNEQLQPAILSSWKTISPLEYQYTLRSGVKFSDGNPVTAADIAYTLNLQLNKQLASQEGGLFENVKSITYSGNTITVQLSHPDALVRSLPATEVGLVYEQASVEKNMLNYGTPSLLPVGAGPYEITQYTPEQVTLVRNPYYYGPKPHFAKIVFKVIPDPNTMLLALRSGEIDGVFNPPNLPEYQGLGTIQKFPGLVWNGLTLDMTEAPFSNVHVRRALYYATDIPALVKGADAGLGVVSSTVDDPRIYKGLLPNATITKLYGQIASFPYSVAKAKQQLAMTKWSHGFTTTLNVPAPDTTDILYSELLQSEWAEIGVNLKLNLMPGGPRFQFILNHGPNLGIQIIGNLPDALDPVEMNWEYFSSQQAAVNGNNSSNLRAPAVDALINAAQAAVSPATEALDSIKASILASKYVPIIPISWLDFAMVFKNGWHESGLQPFSAATYWTEDISS